MEEINLREYYTSKLHGSGLDIGALHRPMVKHRGMEVEYVDRLTTADMRAHYPELSEYPLQEPDILCDAQYLDGVDSRSQDFVIASHVIEHMKNPILALKNWATVVKPGGKIYLVVPDHRYIFDKNRPLTTVDHLLDDYWHPSEQRDFQHYLEYAELVDDCYGERILPHADELRVQGYSIHFHTFTPESFDDLLTEMNRSLLSFPCIEGPGVAREDKHEFHFLLTV